MQIFVIKLKL